MESLRRSYQSKRRFFVNRPDLTTNGRYFEVSPDTPFLPFPHLFGSMRWMRGEILDDPPLGELVDQSFPYDKGAPPVRSPRVQYCGDPLSFSTGETWPQKPARSGIVGIPQCCYARPIAMRATFLADCDLRDPRFLCVMADLGVQSYEADGTEAEEICRAFMGDDSTVSFNANDASIIPGSILCTNKDFCLFWISGTSNRLQWEGHIAAAIFGPTAPIGSWLTTTNTLVATAVLRARLNAFLLGASKPLLLVGHSWGGALAEVLAARINGGEPNRPLKVLTFGGPKAGNAALASVLETLDSMRIVNEDDAVPLLPPNPEVNRLFGIGLVIPPLILDQWALFAHPRGQIVVTQAGDLVETNLPNLAAANVADLCLAIVGNLPFGFVSAHEMGTYALRICGSLNTGEDEFPISKALALDVEEDLRPGACPLMLETIECQGRDTDDAEVFRTHAVQFSPTEWIAQAVAAGETYTFALTSPAGSSDPESYALYAQRATSLGDETVALVVQPGAQCEPLNLNFPVNTFTGGPFFPDGRFLFVNL